ncbi:hypothetical protein JCM14469_36750 [Desulfatiferula olefinivorans]
MRILIADDDTTTRMMLSGILKKSGFEIVEASGGREAMAHLLGPEPPSMAIVDWMMPEIDGIEVIRRVRIKTAASDRPPYLIMLTTKAETADIITGLEAGADDYLSKPFSLDELRARVAVGRKVIDLQNRLAAQIQKLKAALDENRTLQGILPICMFCKKIRNDKGYWDQVEAYVSRHSTAEFSHGICPDCLALHYPDAAGNTPDDSGQ